MVDLHLRCKSTQHRVKIIFVRRLYISIILISQHYNQASQQNPIPNEETPWPEASALKAQATPLLLDCAVITNHPDKTKILQCYLNQSRGTFFSDESAGQRSNYLVGPRESSP